MKELTLHSESYIAPDIIYISIEPGKSILQNSPTNNNTEDPKPDDGITVG